MRTKEFWEEELKLFTVRHPDFIMPGVAPEEEEEQIYTPQEGFLIRFWIEGNLQVKGGNANLEINFNHPAFLILALHDIEQEFHRSIFRIPYERIIGFELIMVK